MSAASQPTESSAVPNPVGTYVIVPFPANPQPPQFWLSLADFIGLFAIRRAGSGQYKIQLNGGSQVDTASYNTTTGAFSSFSFVLNGRTCEFPDFTATQFNGITLLTGTVTGAGVTAKVRGIPNELPIFAGDFVFSTTMPGFNGVLVITPGRGDDPPVIRLKQGTIFTDATDVSYSGVLLTFTLQPPNTQAARFRGLCLPREDGPRFVSAYRGIGSNLSDGGDAEWTAEASGGPGPGGAGAYKEE